MENEIEKISIVKLSVNQDFNILSKHFTASKTVHLLSCQEAKQHWWTLEDENKMGRLRHFWLLFMETLTNNGICQYLL